MRISINFNFCIILFLVFAILKVGHIVAWSWWWVTSPLWIPVILFAVVLVIVSLLALLDEHLR